MFRITNGIFCLVVFICVSSFVKCREIQPRLESLNYCADIKSMRGNYKIVGSEILYGKWTEGAGTSDEISAPTNKAVNELQTVRVCSSGRAFVPSGTEASIVLTENSDFTKSTIKIYWDVPAIGSFSHAMYYNESEHTVIRRKSDSAGDSNLYEYYLFKI
ncbi:uncharacterized protein LOC116345248 [Contarinia nasturtii]|uniref:uncharacterized protein LOC116345248 n=1 Tax=Contarinia nasturtii TaxID=265458 RepID=UPI0012D3D900|nr:uncharacterized protein LOC116345248 [Contarinia nasturtii]